MTQTEPKLILSEPPTVDYFAPAGSLYMNVLVKRTGDVCKPNPGGWSDADGVGLRVRDRILGRLQDDSVVIGGDNKRSCTADVDAPYEDGTAAHDDLHK